jgi:hypothetical protein
MTFGDVGGVGGEWWPCASTDDAGFHVFLVGRHIASIAQQVARAARTQPFIAAPPKTEFFQPLNGCAWVLTMRNTARNAHLLFYIKCNARALRP